MIYLISPIKNTCIVVACGAKGEAQAAIADKGSVFTYIGILLIEKEAMSIEKEAISIKKEAMSIEKEAMSIKKEAISIQTAAAYADTETATLKEEFFLLKKAGAVFKQAGYLFCKTFSERYALTVYLLKSSEFG